MGRFVLLVWIAVWIYTPTDVTRAAVASLMPTALKWCNDNDRPSKAKKVCELEALTEFLLFHTSGDSWPLRDVPVNL